MSETIRRYRRLRLFVLIVWRRWERNDPGSRIGVSLAWEVAGIIFPGEGS